MPFFADRSFEPKRNFRFQVSFPRLGSDISYMVKSVNKPGVSIDATTHRFLNHQFHFPNIVKWDDVNISFIDAVQPNVGSTFYQTLLAAGYLNPVDGIYKGGLTKSNFVNNTIGDVQIKQLLGNAMTESTLAGEPLNPGSQTPTEYSEQWTLKNSIITSIKFGEGMSYDSDEIVGIDITVKYDYATYSGGAQLAGT